MNFSLRKRAVLLRVTQLIVYSDSISSDWRQSDTHRTKDCCSSVSLLLFSMMDGDVLRQYVRVLMYYSRISPSKIAYLRDKNDDDDDEDVAVSLLRERGEIIMQTNRDEKPTRNEKKRVEEKFCAASKAQKRKNANRLGIDVEIE